MNSATSIDILSYHHAADGSILRPSNSKPVFPQEISHFLPVGQLPINNTVAAPSNSTQPKRPVTSNTSKKTESSTQMMQLPKINRASRLQNHEASMIPHLHADQRVRSRSTSKEPQRVLPKDKQKIVAFGRTTTVDNNETTAAPQTHRPTSENARLRIDIEQLRQRVTSNEKLRKEVEELQKTLKTVTTSTKQVEVLTRENKQLRKELDETKKDFEDEVKRSADLAKRVEDLETQFAKFLNAKNASASPEDKSLQSSIDRSYTKVPAPTPLKQSPYLRKDSNLFSRLSPGKNKQIDRIDRHRPARKTNNDSYDDMENRIPRNHIEVSCYQERGIYTELRADDQLSESVYYKGVHVEEASPKRRHNRVRHARDNNFKATRKQLASNQIIDLRETNVHDEFKFN